MKITLMGLALLIIFAGIGDAGIDPKTILGLWLMDEGKGDRVEDSSGWSNHGKLIKGKWTDGKFGKAVHLPGVIGVIGEPKFLSFVRIEDAPNLGNLEEITIACWVFLHSFKGFYDGFVDKTRGETPGWSSYNLSRRLKDNQQQWEWKIVDFKNETYEFQAGFAVLRKWIHLAGTFDGKQMKLYENAVEIGKKVFDGKLPIQDSDSYMGFGHHPGAPNEEWSAMEGIIDEVVMFNVALSKNNIKSIMTQGLEKALAVELRGKLAITWGAIKAR